MPYYALIGHDAPGSLELRKRHRDAHIANLRTLDAAGRVRHAGPLLDDSGAPCGSVVIFEAKSLEAAQAFLSDPGLKVKMEEAGVTSEPRIEIYEEVEVI